MRQPGLPAQQTSFTLGCEPLRLDPADRVGCALQQLRLTLRHLICVNIKSFGNLDDAPLRLSASSATLAFEGR
jgi:hypothetical protein